MHKVSGRFMAGYHEIFFGLMMSLLTIFNELFTEVGNLFRLLLFNLLAVVFQILVKGESLFG